MKEQRPNERGGFAALLAAATAIEQCSPDNLVDALHRAPPQALLRAAARHRCLGYLRRGILELGVRDDRAKALADAVREYASKAAIQAYAVRIQLNQLVETLDAVAVPFALLKGAARLFRGNREADYSTMYDLDILIPNVEVQRAADVLQHAGYRAILPTRALARYWARHHHIAPLHPQGLGLPVELHVQLARPGMLSMPTDWQACEPYFERVVGPAAQAQCLDALGSAVHLVIHGSGIKRLHDAIMLSKIMRSDSDLPKRVSVAIASERWQPVALQSVVALSSQMAGLQLWMTPQVERYLAWVMRREDLSPYVRDRSQFTDAWYSNGGKLWGPATREALPTAEAERDIVTSSARFALRLIGRIITGVLAATSVARS